MAGPAPRQWTPMWLALPKISGLAPTAYKKLPTKTHRSKFIEAILQKQTWLMCQFLIKIRFFLYKVNHYQEIYTDTSREYVNIREIECKEDVSAEVRKRMNNKRKMRREQIKTIRTRRLIRRKRRRGRRQHHSVKIKYNWYTYTFQIDLVELNFDYSDL